MTALQIASLSKSFPGGKGLKGVALDLAPGSVHALLGQNGSGKSTLIKILAGVYQPDPGARARVGGIELELGSARSARDAGIRFIHQDLGLIPELDVAENLALGADYSSRVWLSDRRERRAAGALLERYGIGIDPGATLSTLSPAQQTLVAIARALGDDGGKGGAGSGADSRRVIVLDEPTAALQSAEVAHLFALIGTLKREGNAILYVTHRLEEIFAIADEVTVLRDGAVVATRPVEGLDHDSLVELIVGRRLEQTVTRRAPVDASVALEARGITGGIVDGVDLEVRHGEVVGLAGLLGSGYEQLLFLLAGGEARTSGDVLIDGRAVPGGDPAAAIAAGIAFAPADRKRLSAIQSWSLRENVTLPALRAGTAGWLSDRREAVDARGWLARVEVEHPARALLSTLSGGNQQRVVIARWLRTGAAAILLQEPTNGVDSGAKQAIYACLREAADLGTAVLFSSSDAEELVAVCDRVIVLNGGRIGSVLSGDALTVDTLLRACLAAPELKRASP
jgi:ribose transport system ATP-binding protein